MNGNHSHLSYHNMNLHSHTHIPVYIYIKYYVILIITLYIANDQKLKNIITNGGGGEELKDGWKG